jgi:MarR family transcriptional regulator, negative regulator of the multidrug operon emrRAB
MLRCGEVCGTHIISSMHSRLENLLGALATGCFDLQGGAMTRAVGLDRSELEVLLAIYARPGSTVGDVAPVAALSHSGAVRAVDRLAGSRYVERQVGVDKRTVTLLCTRKGSIASRAALSARASALKDLLSSLDPRAQSAMAGICERLLAAMPRERTDAHRICRFCEHAMCRDQDCPVGSAVK